MKNNHNFHLKIITFTAVKYCCILHGRVCVMWYVTTTNVIPRTITFVGEAVTVVNVQ